MSHRSKSCDTQGFHVPQTAADGPVVFCRDCGALIWSGATPYSPMPANEEIWNLARIDPDRRDLIAKAIASAEASHG